VVLLFLRRKAQTHLEEKAGETRRTLCEDGECQARLRIIVRRCASFLHRWVEQWMTDRVSGDDLVVQETIRIREGRRDA
jgi:hypothetical protein